MLKCPAPESFRFSHMLHLPSGICLLCNLRVLEAKEGWERGWLGETEAEYIKEASPSAASGATEAENVPKAIPLIQVFPGLSSAWASPSPVTTFLEYKTVKKAKPAGVTNITPGDNQKQTAQSVDILSLHFNLQEDDTEDAQTVQEASSGFCGDTYDKIYLDECGDTEAGSGATANQPTPE